MHAVSWGFVVFGILAYVVNVYASGQPTRGLALMMVALLGVGAIFQTWDETHGLIKPPLILAIVLPGIMGVINFVTHDPSKKLVQASLGVCLTAVILTLVWRKVEVSRMNKKTVE